MSETETQGEERDCPERAFNRRFKGKVFRHYKGGTYLTVGSARSEATGELMVLYMEMNRANRYYEHTAFHWVRPWSEFSEIVDGVRRFRQLEGEELAAAHQEFQNK